MKNILFVLVIVSSSFCASWSNIYPSAKTSSAYYDETSITWDSSKTIVTVWTKWSIEDTLRVCLWRLFENKKVNLLSIASYYKNKCVGHSDGYEFAWSYITPDTYLDDLWNGFFSMQKQYRSDGITPNL
jgi:hypothetical protein